MEWLPHWRREELWKLSTWTSVRLLIWSHTTFLPQNLIYGFDGRNVRWIRNWLDGLIHEVTVNVSVSKWKPVMGVHQGSINNFISYLGSGIESTLSNFEKTLTWVVQVIHLMLWRHAIHIDLDRLEEWILVNLMKFNKDNFKVLNLGWTIPDICAVWVKNWLSSPAQKDLRILTDE